LGEFYKIYKFGAHRDKDELIRSCWGQNVKCQGLSEIKKSNSQKVHFWGLFVTV